MAVVNTWQPLAFNSKAVTGRFRCGPADQGEEVRLVRISDGRILCEATSLLTASTEDMCRRFRSAQGDDLQDAYRWLAQFRPRKGVAQAWPPMARLRVYQPHTHGLTVDQTPVEDVLDIIYAFHATRAAWHEVEVCLASIKIVDDDPNSSKGIEFGLQTK